MIKEMQPDSLFTQIKLAYPETPGEITLYFRPFLAQVEKLLKQHLFGMSERERRAAEPGYNLSLFAYLLARPPEGLPEFASLSTPGQIRAYFGDGNPLKMRIVEDSLRAYRAELLPQKYFAAFRVAAWQHVYFRRAVSALDTKFDNCPLYCDRDDLRPAPSCAECDLTLAYEDYQARVEEQMDRFEPDSVYRFQDLQADVSFIAGLADFGERRGTGDDWTITTARLVDIYRSELVKAERVDEFNAKQTTAPADSL